MFAWTGRKSRPCWANSRTHQARMNRPRSSSCAFGSITRAPTSLVSAKRMQSPAGAVVLGAVGGVLRLRPLPDLPRGVSLGVQVVQHLLVLEGVHADPEAVVLVGRQVSFLCQPLEGLVEQVFSV